MTKSHHRRHRHRHRKRSEEALPLRTRRCACPSVSAQPNAAHSMTVAPYKPHPERHLTYRRLVTPKLNQHYNLLQWHYAGKVRT
jgi:hypothetical protein